jgi:cytochrome c biogenesis protein CcmG/thiol:disulfide interchange protein DsbE
VTKLPWISTVTALMLLAGCRPGDGEPRGLVIGEEAPAFEALAMAGDTVSLESLRGAPVLLNLWATWCHPCRTETPYLQSLHERFSPRGLQVVGVSVDSPGALADVREFMTEFGVGYEVLHDPGMSSMDLFYAVGLPATYLIGSDGTLIWSHLGPVDVVERELEQAVTDALAAGPP